MSTMLRRRMMMAKGSSSIPNYLCFTALEDGEFTLTIDANLSTSALQYIEYSLDGNTWVKTNNVNSQPVTITTPIIANGGKVYWRGYGSTLNRRNKTNDTAVTSTCRFDASGEVLSLLRGENFENDRALNNFSLFAGLFKGCDTLINAKDMIINTTNRFPYAFQEMFMNCTNLITTPYFINVDSEYPFISTFQGCTALQYITYPLPQIPTINNRIYRDMFNGCTSLIKTPEFPLYTELPAGAFSGIFRGCTSLLEVPNILPATTLGSDSYQNMFSGCTSLTKAPQIAATNFPANVCKAMFSGCTKLTNVPTINIQSFTGTENLMEMFRGCTSLVHSPLNITLESVSSRCMIWCFRGCTSLSDAYLPSTTLATKSYEEAFRESSVSYVKMLATDISATQCLNNWMFAVPNVSTSIFVKHIDATWTDTGNSGVPTNWTIIYYDPAVDKYYTDQTRATECDDHGNPI